MRPPPLLATLLPSSEKFGPQSPGAVSLVVKDIIEFSNYCSSSLVLGSELQQPFHDIRFSPIQPSSLFFLRRSWRYVLGAQRQLAQINPSLIEIHNRATYLTLLQRLQPKQRYTFHLHNDPQGIRGLESPKQRQTFLTKVAAIYCVSDFVKNRYIEGLTVGHDKVHVIHNGLDMQSIIPCSKPREPVILFVGRIIPEKGVLLFAQAARKALTSLPEKWRIEIVGAKHFGQEDIQSPYEQKVYDTLKDLGPRARYFGHLPFAQTMEKVSTAEIAVVCSQWQEPFGRTALEAMAGGAALISTPYGGLKEVIGDAAICVESNDPEKFAHEIVDLAVNKDQRKTIQIKGRKRAEANFDSRNTTKKLDAIRQKILADKKETLCRAS